ncbi:hypothetical protein VQ056_13475 [Paenibacillus sp. JTLBN-2024]
MPNPWPMQACCLPTESLLQAPAGFGSRYRRTAKQQAQLLGPFSAESGLMESFIMLEAHSIEEALEWAKKAPVPKGRGEAEIELRQLSDQEETYHDPNIMAMETNLREHI